MPANWSAREWAEEMRAQGIAAALQAVDDYDASLGVPFGAFEWQRVMTSAFTRYRQEWKYAVRYGAEPEENQSEIESDSVFAARVTDLMRCAVSRLAKTDRWVIEQLFWRGTTEANIAQRLGFSQQAVNKRKKRILHNLRLALGATEKI